MLFSEPNNRQTLPFTLGIWSLDPHLIHGLFASLESTSNQHLNRFRVSAVFAGLTDVTNRQTDTQTDHATPSVDCSNRPIAAMWPNNYNDSGKVKWMGAAGGGRDELNLNN